MKRLEQERKVYLVEAAPITERLTRKALRLLARSTDISAVAEIIEQEQHKTAIDWFIDNVSETSQ